MAYGSYVRIQNWWHYDAENIDHTNYLTRNAWYAWSCMAEHRISLYAPGKNWKGACWSVRSASAQTLNTEEDFAKRHDHLYQLIN